MKTFFIILIIYINCVLSFEIVSTVNYTLKKYPKKVIPGHVQFINSGKYVKPKQTKKNDVLKTYTAFPRIHNAQKSIPESPLFPFETANEPKTRVKKVLHDYSGPGIRNKRSVPGEHEAAKMRELSKPPIVRGVNKKTHKSGDGIKSRKKHSRKPHSRNKKAKRGGKMSKMGGKRKRKAVKDTGRKGKRHNARSVRKRSKRAQGRRNKPKVSRRLIAARDAKIEEYPYVVSIQKNKEHWCAGALLNPRLIITTANCMWKARRISRMKVRAGSQYVDRGGQVARISDVMKHPGWGIRKDPDYDLALALLDRNLKFSDKIHGVDLPNRVMQPAFDDAWVTSWGAERRDGVYDPSPMTLQVYHARLMNREKCNNITNRFAVTVTSNFICLAQTGRRSPCTRDTGAPAVSDGVLWGLASWGIRKLCGTERFPAMFSYTASDSNMDFIINATHVLMSDQRYYPFPDRLPSH